MLSLRLRHTPTREGTEEAKYTVLLVNERQLEHLMHRQQLHAVGVHDLPIHGQGSGRVHRVAAFGAAALIVGGLAATAWVWRSSVRPTHAFQAAGAPAPVVETGASFNAILAADGGDAARRVASSLRLAGLPAFTSRENRNDQVIVGPYASLDEAERAHQRIAGLGYAEGRVSVDSTLGAAGLSRATSGVRVGAPRVRLVSVRGRLSVAFDLPHEPRAVESRRRTDGTLTVDFGPIARAVTPQRWAAPAQVHLMRDVALEASGGPGELRLTATMGLPAFAQANVRVEGPRVYVDLAWPTTADDDAPPPETVPAPAPPRARPPAGVLPGPEPRHPFQAVRAEALARLDGMTPFLVSAARSASPDVMSALEGALATLEATLDATEPASSDVANHALLMSATREARRAMATAFDGNRLEQVRHALGMLRLARNEEDVPPVPVVTTVAVR